MTETPHSNRLLGYIWLQPGLSMMNGYTFIWACLTGIPFLVVINFIQPFILNVMLDVPTQEQGSISGYLAILHEIILIALTGPFGALSDRVGRRRILTIGYLIAAAGLLVYPWADSVAGLIAIRCFYAVGASAIVSASSVLMADYPQEKSRGKLVALTGVLNGLGILALTGAAGALPRIMVAAGFEQIPAGRIAMGAHRRRWHHQRADRLHRTPGRRHRHPQAERSSRLSNCCDWVSARGAIRASRSRSHPRSPHEVMSSSLARTYRCGGLRQGLHKA